VKNSLALAVINEVSGDGFIDACSNSDYFLKMLSLAMFPLKYVARSFCLVNERR
jgi:hypothetical protein